MNFTTGICLISEPSLTSENKILSATPRLEEKAIFQGSLRSVGSLVGNRPANHLNKHKLFFVLIDQYFKSIAVVLFLTGSDQDNTHCSRHLIAINRHFQCLEGPFAPQKECCKTTEVLVMKSSRFQIQLNDREFYLKASVEDSL